jgi:hypothetical protein
VPGIPKELIEIGLVALAGILIGGVYVTWKSMKFFAIVLCLCALLAAGGAFAWMLS